MKGENTYGFRSESVPPESAKALLDITLFPDDTVIETAFCVNNVMLRFYNYSEHIQQEIHRLLSRYLQSGKNKKKSGEISIHIRPPLHPEILRTISQVNETVHSTDLYPGVPFRVYIQGDIIYFIALEDRCAVLDINNNTAVCYTPENLGGERFYSIINTLVFPLINEFFALRRKYFLHCASVAKDDQGILFAAMSGGGKTTLTLAALSAGYKLVNDDLTILDVNGQAPCFVSFTKEMRICPDVLPMFPELVHLSEHVLDNGKISIWPDTVFKDCLVESVKADIILFPSDYMADDNSDYAPVGIDEAIELLVPHGLFITGKYTLQTRLFSLLDLLKNVRAYKIRSRLDIKRIPHLLDQIINER